MSAWSRSIKNSGLAWALLPVMLLFSMFVGWAVMLSFALDDPSFGVEPNYYDKAIHHDAERAMERESRRLGWRLHLESRRSNSQGLGVLVTLVDAESHPLGEAELRAEAFHLARSSERHHLRFIEGPPGEYRALLGAARPGLWEFRFQADRATEHFVEVRRLEVGAEP
jgi:hypothetical protein